MGHGHQLRSLRPHTVPAPGSRCSCPGHNQGSTRQWQEQDARKASTAPPPSCPERSGQSPILETVCPAQQRLKRSTRLAQCRSQHHYPPRPLPPRLRLCRPCASNVAYLLGAADNSGLCTRVRRREARSVGGCEAMTLCGCVGTVARRHVAPRSTTPRMASHRGLQGSRHAPGSPQRP